MNQKLSELSVFFPAYNEAGNIEETIKQAMMVLPTVAKKFEVIIVNDGSKDATLQVAKRLTKKYRFLKVVNQRNKGYGGALKRGFKEAKYEWVFFSDSDLQFDLQELKTFIPASQTNSLVLGYRLHRAEGRRRQLLALALKLWNRTLLGFPRRIKDVDCAFKLIHQDVLKSIEPLFSDGAMLSTEMLLKAHRAGFTYAQVGVNHYQRRIGSPTGSNLKVITKAIKDTFQLQKQLLANDLVTSVTELRTSFKSLPILR